MTVPNERILIVDDEAPMRRTIARMLDTADYRSVGVASVQEARDELAKGSFDLVLCDLYMPGEDGLVLVEEIEAAPTDTAVLICTVNDDPKTAHKAAAFGANGYLVKPFSVKELLIHVEYALLRARGQEEAAQVDSEQERRVDEVLDVTRQLEQEARAADRQAAELLQPLSEAVARRDLETGSHIRRIGEFSAMLAEASGLNPDRVEAIRLAAPMHDVGKVAIPDAVLLKPGRLNSDERALMERHAQIGHDILSGSHSRLLDLAAEIALTHHEKVDGSGYPHGLDADRIPIAGRIVAVADVYDALTSDRPYRDALSVDEAVEIMVAERGTHFDADLLDLFLDRLDSVKALARNFAETEPVGS
jgi:putative two-component system response regulator